MASGKRKDADPTRVQMARARSVRARMRAEREVEVFGDD